MHSDMGDERGIRLRCICLGDAALRGSRMSARGRCGKGSESRIARSSLSNARSSVCATTRCLRINITVHQIKGRLKFGDQNRGRCGKGSESRIARSSLSNARSSVCATRRCLRINFTIHQKRIMFWQLFLQSRNVWRRKIPSRRGQPCVKRMVVVSFEEHDLHMLAASWPAGFAVLRVGGCHIRSGWEWSRCLGAEPEGHLDATARCRR